MKQKLKIMEKKISDHDQNITTPQFNKFFDAIFDENLKGAKFAAKGNITNLIEKACFNKKLSDF